MSNKYFSVLSCFARSKSYKCLFHLIRNDYWFHPPFFVHASTEWLYQLRHIEGFKAINCLRMALISNRKVGHGFLGCKGSDYIIGIKQIYWKKTLGLLLTFNMLMMMKYIFIIHNTSWIPNLISINNLLFWKLFSVDLYMGVWFDVIHVIHAIFINNFVNNV